MKNSNISGVHWKIQFLRMWGGGGGGLTKNQYREENCLKRGRGLGQLADLRVGAWQERKGVFEMGLMP